MLRSVHSLHTAHTTAKTVGLLCDCRRPCGRLVIHVRQKSDSRIRNTQNATFHFTCVVYPIPIIIMCLIQCDVCNCIIGICARAFKRPAAHLHKPNIIIVGIFIIGDRGVNAFHFCSWDFQGINHRKCAPRDTSSLGLHFLAKFARSLAAMAGFFF